MAHRHHHHQDFGDVTERYPDRVVFDLDPGPDPGPGAGLAGCVEVAVYLRERLGPLGDRIVPVTSGHPAVPSSEGSDDRC